MPGELLQEVWPPGDLHSPLGILSPLIRTVACGAKTQTLGCKRYAAPGRIPAEEASPELPCGSWGFSCLFFPINLLPSVAFLNLVCLP